MIDAKLIESFRWPLAFLTALLLILGAAPFSLPETGWVALTPAWLLLQLSPAVAKRPFRYGYFIGVITFGAMFWWIENVTAVGAIFMTFFLALYPAFWFLLVGRISNPAKYGVIKSDTAPTASESTEVIAPKGMRTLLGKFFPSRMAFAILGAACFWVTLEWVRSWFATGFNWNELGHSQAESFIFRQLASVGGVPFVSFFLVVVSLLWAEGICGWLKNASPKPDYIQVQFAPFLRLSTPITIAISLTLIAYCYGWFYSFRHTSDKPLASLSFTCIQPNIPQLASETATVVDYQAEYQRAIDKQVALSEQAAEHHPQLILWPECTTGYDVLTDAPFAIAVQHLLLQYHGNVLLGSMTRETQVKGSYDYYNSAVLFSNVNFPKYRIQHYNKIYLVVLGEYVPLSDDFPTIRDWLQLGTDFRRGTHAENFQIQGSPLTVAPLICFEDTVPEVVDGAAQVHPSFLATISDDAWYRGWCATWGVNQHFENARFRCVEHDLPLVRCGNNGLTCLLDQNGELVAKFVAKNGKSIDQEGLFEAVIRPYPTHGTLYERFGSQLLLIFNLITIIFTVRFFIVRDSSKPVSS